MLMSSRTRSGPRTEDVDVDLVVVHDQDERRRPHARYCRCSSVSIGTVRKVRTPVLLSEGGTSGRGGLAVGAGPVQRWYHPNQHEICMLHLTDALPARHMILHESRDSVAAALLEFLR